MEATDLYSSRQCLAVSIPTNLSKTKSETKSGLFGLKLEEFIGKITKLRGKLILKLLYKKAGQNKEKQDGSKY